MCPRDNSSRTLLPLPQTKNDSNFHSAFDVLDIDGDGKISRNDLRAFCEGISSSKTTLGKHSDEEDVIGSMMLHADSNKDGYVEYNEFEKILQVSGNFEKELKNGRLSFMEDAFRLMDRDGDGKVGYEDLKSFLKCCMGFDVNDDDVKAMIKLGEEGHQNGGVTFSDFLNIFAI